MHPSITLLVHYRSQVCMPPCDGYTSLFKLQSQATLLGDTASHIPVIPAHGSAIRDSLPVSWVHSRTLLGTGKHRDTANCSIAHRVCWIPTKADRDAPQPRHHAGDLKSGSSSQEAHFQEEPWVLLVHSPLLQQSRLLAVPPLSDMLKFGGSFHVRQVTRPVVGRGHWDLAC